MLSGGGIEFIIFASQFIPRTVHTKLKQLFFSFFYQGVEARGKKSRREEARQIVSSLNKSTLFDINY